MEAYEEGWEGGGGCELGYGYRMWVYDMGVRYGLWDSEKCMNGNTNGNDRNDLDDGGWMTVFSMVKFLDNAHVS